MCSDELPGSPVLLTLTMNLRYMATVASIYKCNRKTVSGKVVNKWCHLVDNERYQLTNTASVKLNEP